MAKLTYIDDEFEAFYANNYEPNRPDKNLIYQCYHLWLDERGSFRGAEIKTLDKFKPNKP